MCVPFFRRWVLRTRCGYQVNPTGYIPTLSHVSGALRHIDKMRPDFRFQIYPNLGAAVGTVFKNCLGYIFRLLPGDPRRCCVAVPNYCNMKHSYFWKHSPLKPLRKTNYTANTNYTCIAPI